MHAVRMQVWHGTNHTIVNGWNATVTAGTARSSGQNGTLAPSGSTTFGFQVRRPSGNTQVPSGYTCTSP